jgi:hypothetical protein
MPGHAGRRLRRFPPLFPGSAGSWRGLGAWVVLIAIRVSSACDERVGGSRKPLATNMSVMEVAKNIAVFNFPVEIQLAPSRRRLFSLVFCKRVLHACGFNTLRFPRHQHIVNPLVKVGTGRHWKRKMGIIGISRESTADYSQDPFAMHMVSRRLSEVLHVGERPKSYTGLNLRRCINTLHGEPRTLVDNEIMAKIFPLQVSDKGISYGSNESNRFQHLPPGKDSIPTLIGFPGLRWGRCGLSGNRRMDLGGIVFLMGDALLAYGLFVLLPWSSTVL